MIHARDPFAVFEFLPGGEEPKLLRISASSLSPETLCTLKEMAKRLV